jgi:hypothetical protein
LARGGRLLIGKAVIDSANWQLVSFCAVWCAETR